MSIYNPFWWVRKKHDEDYEQAFKDSGCIKEKFFIRRFNGKAFWEAFEKRGHTHGRVEECVCWRERCHTDCPYKEKECPRGLKSCTLCPDRKLDIGR